MFDIIPFNPNARKTAEKNLVVFVDYAKSELTIFGSEDFVWDAVSWHRKKRNAGIASGGETVGWVKLGS